MNKPGSQIVGLLLITLVLIAYAPNFVYGLLAVMFGLVFVMLALSLMAALSKGFAILGIEFWFLRWLYKRR